MKKPQLVRRRDAAATKSAILSAARTLFARDSYENVGIREIASLSGADAALVSRYFGSKEELFSEVLRSGKRGLDLIGEQMEGLPERVADLLLEPPEAKEENPMDDILILLHSASSPTAAPLVQASIDERFHRPFAEVIGGDHAMTRSQIFGALLMGVSISMRITGQSYADEDERKRVHARISRLVELAILPL
ncbi:MAG: TetR/AcrR family transcriptional regulator [Hyphomonas sp.]